MKFECVDVKKRDWALNPIERMHPLSGSLRARGLKRGVASLCIGGGGEATAMAIEMA